MTRALALLGAMALALAWSPLPGRLAPGPSPLFDDKAAGSDHNQSLAALLDAANDAHAGKNLALGDFSASGH